MYQLTHPSETQEIAEIQKGLHRIGLTISESEINELRERKSISLETRGLSEIGLVFIMAAALSTDKISFQNLPCSKSDSESYSGVPIYSWNSNSQEQSCLYLNFVDGKPVVSIVSK